MMRFSPSSRILLLFLTASLFFWTTSRTYATNQCANLFDPSFNNTASLQPAEIIPETQSLPTGPGLSFEMLKKEIQTRITAKNDLTPLLKKDAIARLALIEIIAEKSGWDILNLRNAILESSTLNRLRLMQTLKRMTFTSRLADYRWGQALGFRHGISAYQVDILLHRLHRFSGSVPRGMIFSAPEAKRRIQSRRAEISFLNKSFVEAFKELSLDRAPHVLEQVKIFHLQNRNFFNVLVSAAFNIFAMSYAGVPDMPSAYFDKWSRVDIPDHVMKRIRECGPECSDVKNYFRNKFPNKPQFEWAWKNLRRVYKTAMLTYFVFMAVKMYPMIKFTIGLNQVTEKSLKEYRQTHFDPQRIRAEQFTNWRESFRESEGRYPDPKHYPEDAVEYNTVFNSLYRATDAELQRDYGGE